MSHSSSSLGARRSGAPGVLRGLSWWLAAALLVLPPLLVLPEVKEPFRLPKLLASETLVLLGLVSLVALLAFSRLEWSRLWSQRGVWVAVAPLVLLATLSRLTTTHPEHVAEALWSLWIGAAALVAWSLGLKRFRSLLLWLLLPAALLAALALWQYFGLSADETLGRAARVQMTSRAGSVGDLAAFLVLPCLVAQMLFASWLPANRSDAGGPGGSSLSAGRRIFRGGVVVGFLLSVAVLVLSQTLAAIAALGAASLLFWWLVVQDRRVRFGLAVVAAASLLAVVLVGPLAERFGRAADQVAAGQLNAVLSGRLDGWMAGLWMLRENPLTGVGHGAYGAAFGQAKLAMEAADVDFYRRHLFPTFGNAHNEFVEVGAELGWPGLLALGWGLVWLARRLRRRLATRGNGTSYVESVFALTAVVALGVLSLAYFPFRLALTAFPALVVLAWIASDDFLPLPDVDEAGAP